MNKLYRFQYFTEDNLPSLHQQRDLASFVELSNILYKNGYEYEDTFLNYPGMEDKKSGLITFDKNDLMILTTRPPLTDKFQKRKIYRTGHVYEKQMLEQIRTCFKSLSRQKLYLQDSISSKLKKGFRNRSNIEFYANKTEKNISAGYKLLSGMRLDMEINWKKSKAEERQKSCAFIILFHKKGILPKMLHVFGIGGEEGLAFSRMLRNGLWDNLKIDLNEGPERIIMVELEMKIPAKYPTNLDFVKNIQYDIILDTSL